MRMILAALAVTGTAAVVTNSDAYKEWCPTEAQGSNEQTSRAAFLPARFVVQDETEDDYVQPLHPGLKVGDEVPELTLLNEEGEEVDLATLYEAGPVVLTFYRGGWCPYCTRALANWNGKIEELNAAGGTFVGLTPEKPEYTSTTSEKYELGYTILSDAEGEAARGFKVMFRLDDSTIEKYKGYGIDLSKHNNDGEWTLPAPATFVIGTDGVVQWVWADWDYSKRADPDEVIAALKKVIEQS